METATHPAQLGFAHFIAQADMLAHFLLAILLAMSVITWYLIVSKSIANWRMKKNAWASGEAAAFPASERQYRWAAFI